MNSAAVVRVADSTSFAPTLDLGSLERVPDLSTKHTPENEQNMSRRLGEKDRSELQLSLVAELDLGFSHMARATGFKHSRQMSEFKECLERASSACESARRVISELPPDKAAEFQMRFNALQSVVLDATNTGLARAMARG